jgi:hypothetical protein
MSCQPRTSPTNSTDQIPFWEANSSSASQAIPRILRIPKVHYRVHKTQKLVPFLSQIHPFHDNSRVYSYDFQVASSPWTFHTITLYTPLPSYVPHVPPISVSPIRAPGKYLVSSSSRSLLQSPVTPSQMPYSAPKHADAKSDYVCTYQRCVCFTPDIPGALRSTDIQWNSSYPD